MVERKIIFKCVIGSNLYGTNVASSDEDYSGVFIPSSSDIFDLEEVPKEWTENDKKSTTLRNQKGDVDCKYFSLKQFFYLAARGQAAQRELFFIPKDKILISTPEWEEIVKNKDLFLTTAGYQSFVKFSHSQMEKSVIKGENLQQVRYLLTLKDKAIKLGIYHHDLGRNLSSPDENLKVFLSFDENKLLFDLLTTNNKGNKINSIVFIGREYNYSSTLKSFFESLNKIEKTYGSRSEDALNNTYDMKNLYHAYRLLGEIEEFLLTGQITFPRPNAEFLKQVRRGEISIDHKVEIAKLMEYAELEVFPKSKLPSESDYSKLNKLYKKIMTAHFIK